MREIKLQDSGLAGLSSSVEDLSSGGWPSGALSSGDLLSTASESEASVESQADANVKAAPFVRAEQKVGRNEPCPCGSGKKYKQCCGKLA